MRSLLPAFIVAVVALGSPGGAGAQHSSAAEIAPSGRLRVGFQTASPILARQAPDGSVSGVVVDLGRFIAASLDVAFEPVVYANQEAYAQSFGKGEWDVVIGVRSLLTDPSPDFMVADAMYIAAPGREFTDAAMVDSPEVRVGVLRGGGSDRILTRALKFAQVVRVPGGVSNAVEALRGGRTLVLGAPNESKAPPQLDSAFAGVAGRSWWLFERLIRPAAPLWARCCSTGRLQCSPYDPRERFNRN